MKMKRFPLFVILLAAPTGAADHVGPDTTTKQDVGPFVRALWLWQRHGLVDPLDDAALKGALFKALGKDGSLNFLEAKGLMDPSTFARLAGSDGTLDAVEIRERVEADVPATRGTLRPDLREHLDGLSTGLDLISDRHRDAARALGDWIAGNHRAGRPTRVVTVCTGNTRRSVLSAMMGNAAADYHGLPEVRFHSGGTDPDAVNPRTVAALRAIGFQVEPTGREAARSLPDVPNPIHRISWGTSGDESWALEFSKRYTDPANPQADFAALMVCGETDEACPVVKGASTRVSMPFLDPKVFDGGAYESAKYAERRDDIGRVLLSALLHARRTLDGVSTR
ncbi:MAG: hypothetical protein AB7I30_15170 [Isosphaeraceae bacterium]